MAKYETDRTETPAPGNSKSARMARIVLLRSCGMFMGRERAE